MDLLKTLSCGFKTRRRIFQKAGGGDSNPRKVRRKRGIRKESPPKGAEEDPSEGEHRAGEGERDTEKTRDSTKSRIEIGQVTEGKRETCDRKSHAEGNRSGIQYGLFKVREAEEVLEVSECPMSGMEISAVRRQSTDSEGKPGEARCD